jgi:hypothetical protein
MDYQILYSVISFITRLVNFYKKEYFPWHLVAYNFMFFLQCNVL